MRDTIYVLTNRFKDEDGEIAKFIAAIVSKEMQTSVVWSENDIKDDAKVVCVIGGDGTMLQSIKRLNDKNIPIVGFNRGTLGFLTELEDSNVQKGLTEIIRDAYEIEERIILEGNSANTKEEGQTISYNGFAVNDFVFKASECNLVTIKVYVNTRYMDTYICDGLIFATPTGSTAYNLSAGGPVLMPETNAIAITPICPHSVNKRSIIVPDKDEIRIEIGRSKEYATDKISVSSDGNIELLLETGDSFSIKKSSKTAKIIRLGESNVINRILTKLNH